MFIQNIMIHRCNAIIFEGFLNVEFSEVFLKVLYITLSLKCYILLNSHSGIAFLANKTLKLAPFVIVSAKNPVKKVALSEP